MNSNPPVLTEAEIRAIVAGTLAGDNQVFGTLVRTYQPYAFSLAFRLLHNEQDALDAVQDVFINVWRRLGQYDPSRKFTTWLYALVSNRCMDLLRSRRRRVALFESNQETLKHISGGPDLTLIHSNKELAEIIGLLTAHLPPTQRLVFVLRDLQNLTVEETAESTGLSVTSVKANLSYARKRIRHMLTRRYQIGGVSS